MTSEEILIEWFSEGKKPTGEQFEELITSLRKEGEQIPINEIDDLPETLNEINQSIEKIEENFGDKHLRIDVGEPSSTWKVEHNLGKIPSIQVWIFEFENPVKVEAFIESNTEKTTTIIFNQKQKGYIIFN